MTNYDCSERRTRSQEVSLDCLKIEKTFKKKFDIGMFGVPFRRGPGA